MTEKSGQPIPYFRTKPVETIMEEAREKESGLKRVLTAVDLTAIGVGAIIGAGIFVMTGKAAATAAGPSIMLSYIFTGFICILCAFCYAEFAARLPISGSAYTYAYASVGELLAWIIGWDLMLEYTLGAATVAVAWGEYLATFLNNFHIMLPYHIVVDGHTLNPVGGLIVILLSALLAIGIKESARVNTVVVAVKLSVVLFVILVGMFFIKPHNWSDNFMPFGPAGIFTGAALIFFAYIGFDAVSTAAEEVIEPQKNLPIGIVASLLICTLLYVLVSGVITGMVPYYQIDKGAPLAAAFGTVGLGWAEQLIGLGGVAGLTTVILILLLSQPRIFYSMSRDGLLPGWFAKVHPKFRTPFNATVVTGLVSACMATFVSLDELADMVNIGTLLAFAIVCGSVLISRYKNPEKPLESTWTTLVIVVGLAISCLAISAILENPALIHGFNNETQRLIIGLLITVFPTVVLFLNKNMNVPQTFKCPWVPIIPVVGMFGSILMMVRLPGIAWFRLLSWLAIGLLIYAFYGIWHSKLSVKTDS